MSNNSKNSTVMKKNDFRKYFAFLFAYIKKMLYLCIAFSKV